jgi:hypothetical protein
MHTDKVELTTTMKTTTKRCRYKAQPSKHLPDELTVQDIKIVVEMENEESNENAIQTEDIVDNHNESNDTQSNYAEIIVEDVHPQ